MDYVIAVQAPAYPFSATRFATESAFAQHLKQLRISIGSAFDRVVLLAPAMTDAQYAAGAGHLSEVDFERDGVLFVPAHRTDTSAKRFWLRESLKLWRRILCIVRRAGVVHSGVADDIWRPLMAMVNFAAWLQRRPVMFLVDIDFREHSRRFRQVGLWNFRQYLVNRLVYDPLVYAQVWLAPRMFQLVLLKSASMVKHFGKGRPHVKNFYDVAHCLEDVLTEGELQVRIQELRCAGHPLQVVYFGRFVPYKGLDKAIEAVRIARQRGADVRLTLIGSGECEADLRAQVIDADLDDAVSFMSPVPYGPELFERLRSMHVCVATPLVEDTPRAAFDALARGIPLLAFDISYFRDLAQASQSVVLSPWPDPEALAKCLEQLAADPQRLADMAARGVEFARANTQSIWLQRRAKWMQEVVRPPVDPLRFESH
ncbi:glycosyltransferase family 4 protein [Caldimonas manganoxidans]|uniref:glycosyltransferase family 4 protein n=1 Tax=Caldimonas manganoxidans TaxID=196015 RepID=UPI00037CCAAC|nr:glycosyltransferase [Caldimonas manganoxidans]